MTQTPKFKVGDRIRGTNQIDRGVATVVGILPKGDCPFVVYFENGDYNDTVNSDVWELVPPEPRTVTGLVNLYRRADGSLQVGVNVHDTALSAEKTAEDQTHKCVGRARLTLTEGVFEQ